MGAQLEKDCKVEALRQGTFFASTSVLYIPQKHASQHRRSLQYGTDFCVAGRIDVTYLVSYQKFVVAEQGLRSIAFTTPLGPLGGA